MSHRDNYMGVRDGKPMFAPKKTGLKKLWSDFKATRFGSDLTIEFGDTSKPVKNMAYDFLNTFKPYTGRDPVKTDAKQIVVGLKNAINGVLLIIGTPLKTVVRSVTGFKQGPKAGFKTVGIQLGMIIPRLLTAVATLVRGVTQIAAYPLTLCLKIPLRIALTQYAARKKHAQMKYVRIDQEDGQDQSPHAATRDGDAPRGGYIPPDERESRASGYTFEPEQEGDFSRDSRDSAESSRRFRLGETVMASECDPQSTRFSAADDYMSTLRPTGVFPAWDRSAEYDQTTSFREPNSLDSMRLDTTGKVDQMPARFPRPRLGAGSSDES